MKLEPAPDGHSRSPQQKKGGAGSGEGAVHTPFLDDEVSAQVLQTTISRP
jgi:hypothetical protein